MLLSFSVDYMRPYVEAGIRQNNGEDVGAARVKRQTIRKLGPVAKRLIKFGIRPVMPLHLWWKSRTKEKAFLGVVPSWRITPVYIANCNGAPVIEIDRRAIDNQDQFAIDDGFDSLDAFLAYFVPNAGDVFNGVLYKW